MGKEGKGGGNKGVHILYKTILPRCEGVYNLKNLNKRVHKYLKIFRGLMAPVAK